MRFCPECRSAFQDGAAECPDCKVALVDKLAEEETRDFVEVYKVASAMEAETIEAMLKDGGIETFLRGTGIPSVPMMGENGMIIIEVRSDQAEQAKKIIEELESAPPPDMEDPEGGSQKSPGA